MQNKRITKWDIVLLILIMSMMFAGKIFLTYNYKGRFINDDSYFHMRKAIELKKNIIPNFNDKLSFSGRLLIFLPGFDYLNALLLILFNTSTVFFIIQKILSTLFIIPIFLITLKLTKSKSAAYLAALTGATTPIIFGTTTQSVTPLNISLFLFLMLIYYEMRIKEENMLRNFLIFLTLLLITSSLTWTFIISMFILLLLEAIERLNSGIDIEITAFSGIIILLFYVIVFKPLITSGVLGNLFLHIKVEEIKLSSLTYILGTIPLIIGLYEFQKHLFNKETKDKRRVYLLLSIITGATILSIITPNKVIENLSVIGAIGAILNGLFYKELKLKINKTKISKSWKLISMLLFLIIVGSNIMLCAAYTTNLLKQGPSEEEIGLMNFINKKTPNNTVIFAKQKYGNIINYYGRKNIIDSNIIGIKDIEKRYEDVSKLYKTFSIIEALNILNYYNADYVLYDDKPPEYTNDECFEKAFNNTEFSLFKVECKVAKSKVQIR